MHKHTLITTFAALCVTISTADAMPVASLQSAAEQQDSHESLLQTVTWDTGTTMGLTTTTTAATIGRICTTITTIPTTAIATSGTGNHAGTGIGTKSLALILVRQCAMTDRAPD